MTTARVTEAGILLTPEFFGVLGVQAGDQVVVTADQDGVNIKRLGAEESIPVKVAKQVMEERRDVLRRLAE